MDMRKRERYTYRPLVCRGDRERHRPWYVEERGERRGERGEKERGIEREREREREKRPPKLYQIRGSVIIIIVGVVVVVVVVVVVGTLALDPRVGRF